VIFCYQAYGLQVKSEVELPELLASTAQRKPDDVFIETGLNSERRFSNEERVGPFLWASVNRVRLKVPGIAEYVIENGTRICFEPLDESELQGARALLHSFAFPCLLYQRGFVVLRGNAIANERTCCLLIGPTGIGKSTLAAAMLLYGFVSLSDEIIAIDDGGYCHQGISWLRLWPDAIQTLKLPFRQESRVRPKIEKRYYVNGPLSSTDPRAISLVIQLGARNHISRKASIRELAGVEKAAHLQHSNFSWPISSKTGLKAEHSKQIWEIGRDIKMFQAIRASGTDTISDMLGSVLGVVSASE